MKKNGFTLIELLGVVTILGMLSLIVVPTISKIISDNKKTLYNTQILNIKSAASDYVSENVFCIDIVDGSSKRISLGKLRELGYIDKVFNPITKKEFPDDMNIIVSSNSNSFSYKVCDDDTPCDVSVDELVCGD